MRMLGAGIDAEIAHLDAAEWTARISAGDLPALTVSARERCDLELIGNGALSPLDGFLGRDDYQSVVHHLRLRSGLIWPVPVVLGADETAAAQLREGQDVALLDADGQALAVLHLREKYLLSHDEIRAEAREVYRTEEEAHPGVRAVYVDDDVSAGISPPVEGLRCQSASA